MLEAPHLATWPARGWAGLPAHQAWRLAVVAPQQRAVLQRHNVHVIGAGKPTLLFCNGFGCNQHIWDHLTPMLADHYQLVFFDQLGTGEADLTAYDPQRYTTMQDYAHDVVEICEALQLYNTVIIGHSAGATIAMLAAIAAPQYFSKAVLLATSPCYLNEPGYRGGFERADVLAVLATMQTDYQAWTIMFATMLIGQDHPESLGYKLAENFCQADLTIARQFARLAYLADHRAEVPQLRLPTLLLQCSEDVAVPPEVGEYLLAHLPHATLVTLRTTGHCPHLSAPLEVLAALQAFLAE